MVYRRLPQTIGEDDRTRILDRAGRLRQALTSVRVDYHSAQYEMLHALMSAIDDLAEDLTGRREFFHATGFADKVTPETSWRDSGSR